MNINIEKTIKKERLLNEINIKIETNKETKDIDKLIEYIENYNKMKIVLDSNNELITINTNEILYFFSDKKYNYCKTTKKEYKIKSKLYELEKMNIDFLRISKSCVVNIKQVKSFDLSESGKIVVKFYNGSQQIVSRRKIKEVMNYLEERSI